MPSRHCLTFVTHTALYSTSPFRPSFPSLSSRAIPRIGLLTSSRRSITYPLFPSSRTVCALSSDDSPDATVGYEFHSFERKWQKTWLSRGDFRTPPFDLLDKSKPKYYVLDMFPYPSGAGLHVGHPEGYTATDILARFRRKTGYNVLHPMGWDAFGLPAEQYALQTGTHPAITTERNINRFRQQLQALGFSYDWQREVRTTDPSYYKWTQWIFLKLWEKGLAYQDDKPVNWCPALGTVLANEEVIDGLSERGGHPVERRPMKQWVLKITAYAERLLEDLELLDWPENVKEMQRNWIGKSVGVELDFNVIGDDSSAIKVYTTRPETANGVSYVVVAPEWDGLMELVTEGQKAEVEAYVQNARKKSDRERTGDGAAKQKTGVWTGRYARNPVNGENVQVWVGDFVLVSYGTGAVMAVPAHDSRDFEFASKYSLPIKQVIRGDVSEGAFTGDGEMMNWGTNLGIELDGMMSSQAKKELMRRMEELNIGKTKVNYKLRDWLFSRQRYWGEPFPLVFVDGQAKAVDESELPVELPEVDSYQPSGTGQSPLSVAESWVNTVDTESGKAAVRETNTMPQWAGSCWYYLRFIDPDNVGAPVDPELEKYWMPVDMYVGGVEHAVLHLLYARFWHKVLYDVGVVSTKEPFIRLVNQGMILGEVEYTGYQDDTGKWVSAKDVDTSSNVMMTTGEGVKAVHVESERLVKKGEWMALKGNEQVLVSARAHKMSKSRGNVVNPDSIIKMYGADALRCYLMFMGPLEQVKPWGTKGVQGMSRFLGRAWRLIVDPTSDEVCSAVTEADGTAEQMKVLHQTIKRVGDDVEGLRFNTAISGLMEFVNAATKWERRPKEVLRPFLSMLGIFAPHIAEELWERMQEVGALAEEPWPEYRAEFDVEEKKTIVIQVNGKVRSRLEVSSTATKDDILSQALEMDGVQRYVSKGTVKKQIYVPNKLVNLVVVAQ